MTGLPEVSATRYVTALREGGSLPGLVEADDLGMYVVKFRGAGQGRNALVAEVVAGELARRLGFRVPELVTVQIDAELGRGEPDAEIQDLLRASVGRNLGMDYLPGSLGYDPAACEPDPTFASRLLWFDALVSNVDRSWRNPNLLMWHGDAWLIDHGAALYFHHSWPTAAAAATRPYATARDHVTIRAAWELATADADLAPLVTTQLLYDVVALVPDDWLVGEAGFSTPEQVRTAYVRQLRARLAGRREWLTALDKAVSGAAHL